MKLATIRTAVLWLAALGLLGGFSVFPMINLVGNSIAKGGLAPAATPAPPMFRAALWARALGAGPYRVVPLTEWNLFGLMTCHVVNGEVLASTREQSNAAHEQCMETQPGLLLADQVARIHLRDSLGKPRFPIEHTATMGRLTREWQIEQLLDTIAERQNFGHEWSGLEAASHGYFGKDAASLTAAEAALLAALVPQPGATDPWCRPDRSRAERDHVLQRMRRNGAIDEAALRAALDAPLGVMPGECPPSTSSRNALRSAP